MHRSMWPSTGAIVTNLWLLISSKKMTLFSKMPLIIITPLLGLAVVISLFLDPLHGSFNHTILSITTTVTKYVKSSTQHFRALFYPLFYICFLFRLNYLSEFLWFIFLTYCEGKNCLFREPNINGLYISFNISRQYLILLTLEYMTLLVKYP